MTLPFSSYFFNLFKTPLLPHPLHVAISWSSSSTVSLSFLCVRRFSFFYFILFLNFTILYWFCHISQWIRHRHTCVPHPEPSSLLPPHTIPLGRSSAPAPSIQYRASNLDWRLVSYMILYIFQCHSPKSSHPLPLPQSSKDCPPLFLKQSSGVCCFPSHDDSKFQCLTQTFHHSTCLS